MAVAAEVSVRSLPRPPTRSVRIGRRQVPVLGPSIRDPRIHLAFVIVSIIAIGILWLDFRLSVPQVLVALVCCGAIEATRTYRSTGVLAWPASALQTATSTALILRITGQQPHDWWTLDGWYYFAGIAVAGLLTKYLIRYRGRHVFNPSNVALVVAFLVFGAERIEPLDFWWGPFGWAMLLAYLVIVAGGISLCGRLQLLGMALAFYVTFAIGVGVLAVLGQSITTQWSLTPVGGAHYWWVLVTSPETLIFLFFMITDPKTTPTGRTPRIVFGSAVAVVSTILLAPWPTEYGTKVGLLSGLVVVCAARPLLETWASARAERRLRAVRHRPDLATAHRPPHWVGAMATIVGLAGFATVVALAGSPNRGAAADEPPPPPAAVDVSVDPATLPIVTIDERVAGLSAELATQQGAQGLAAALAFNLELEAEAIRSGDDGLLLAVDHGARLEDLQALIAAAPAERVVPRYRFDTLHLSIVYPGGFQSGANAGLTATGTVTHVTYSADGRPVSTTEEPIDITFSLRQFPSGRWLTTDTPSSERAR
jgi:Na+-translocating ferredoxin:NAD+ oxidoreductase RnfD subunit